MSPVSEGGFVCPFVSLPDGSKRVQVTPGFKFFMKKDYKQLMSPEACEAWLRRYKPEFALPCYVLRRLAQQVGSGLEAVILPVAGTKRRRAVKVRPADVVRFISECDKERALV